MIFNFFIGLFYGLGIWILGFLPEVGNLPQGFQDAWNWIADIASGLLYVMGEAGSNIITIVNVELQFATAVGIFLGLNYLMKLIFNRGK